MFLFFLLSINLNEVIEFFRHTINSAHDEEEKLDEHLQPIPPELHGAVTRTSPELLKHYELLGTAQSCWINKFNKCIA